MKPVTFERGCPVCRGTVAFDLRTLTYRCQNDGCDYSRRTLQPDPKELTVVNQNGKVAEMPAEVVEATQPKPIDYSMSELANRWHITEGGAKWRIKHIGGVTERMEPGYRAPVEIVEKVETIMTVRGQKPEQANSMPGPRRSAPAAPIAPETALSAASVPARVQRLRLALQHVVDASRTDHPLICAIARLALELDAVE